MTSSNELIDVLMKQIQAQLSQETSLPNQKTTAKVKNIAPEIIDALTKQIHTQLGKESVFPSQNSTARLKVTPSSVLVILGLLGGVLNVSSILIDNEQGIQIRLDGSLKRPSKLDKCLDEMGAMPFDEVLRAIVGRL